MKLLKSMTIAAAALAVSAPALAGRTEDQIRQHDRMAKEVRAQQHALAGPIGERGSIGPGKSADPRFYNVGHPTERVRR